MEHKGKPEFHPLPGKVAVEVDKSEKQGILYLPASAQESRVYGRVIAIGLDVEDVKVGDEILFGKNSGVKVSLGRGEAVILRESEILTVVTWPEDSKTVEAMCAPKPV